MAIPLAFDLPSARAPTFTRISPCARGGDVVRARICRELGDNSPDVLWRLTTKPWARARRSVARPPRGRFRDVIEGTVTALAMVGMAFVSLACLAV